MVSSVKLFINLITSTRLKIVLKHFQTPDSDWFFPPRLWILNSNISKIHKTNKANFFLSFFQVETNWKSSEAHDECNKQLEAIRESAEVQSKPFENDSKKICLVSDFECENYLLMNMIKLKGSDLSFSKCH